MKLSFQTTEGPDASQISAQDSEFRQGFQIPNQDSRFQVIARELLISAITII